MKKLYIAFLALVLALAMIMPVGVANAGSGQVGVSGGITFNFAGIEVNKTVGENGVMKGTLDHFVIYTGDITGTAMESLSFSLNPNSGEFPNYRVSSMGTQIFTGTVLGKEGTFTAHVRHEMKIDGSGMVEETIVSGTGDLSNLHGTIIFMIYRQIDGSYRGTYSGTLHFAP